MEAHHNEDPGMTINHQRKTSLPMPTSLIDHMIADPTSSSSDNNKNGGSTGKSVKFLSQPVNKVPSLYIETCQDNDNDSLCPDNHQHQHHHQQHHQSGQLQNQKPASHKLKDHRYNSFKTWSGRLERQFTRKPASIPETPNRAKEHLNTNHEAMPVDRYFAALEGPELETLRVLYLRLFLSHLH